jgi:hypothetical protein
MERASLRRVEKPCSCRSRRLGRAPDSARSAAAAHSGGRRGGGGSSRPRALISSLSGLIGAGWPRSALPGLEAARGLGGRRATAPRGHSWRPKSEAEGLAGEGASRPRSARLRLDLRAASSSGQRRSGAVHRPDHRPDRSASEPNTPSGRVDGRQSWSCAVSGSAFRVSLLAGHVSVPDPARDRPLPESRSVRALSIGSTNDLAGQLLWARREVAAGVSPLLRPSTPRADVETGEPRRRVDLAWSAGRNGRARPGLTRT